MCCGLCRAEELLHSLIFSPQPFNYSVNSYSTVNDSSGGGQNIHSRIRRASSKARMVGVYFMLLTAYRRARAHSN